MVRQWSVISGQWSDLKSTDSTREKLWRRSNAPTYLITNDWRLTTDK
jgi:hypothetical protein